MLNNCWLPKAILPLNVSLTCKRVNNLGKKKLSKACGITTLYQFVGDQQVVIFFVQRYCGVAAIHGLRCNSSTSSSLVTPEETKAVFYKIGGPSVNLPT